METLGQMQNSIRIITLFCTISLISGCSLFSVYKRDEPQGNLITAEMVQTIKPGMTREQILYVMGAPVLNNAFDADQWDYVYRLNASDDKVYIKRVSITFEKDRAVNIEKDGDIDSTPLVKPQGGPATETTVSQNPGSPAVNNN